MRLILVAAAFAGMLQEPPPSAPTGGRIAWGRDPVAAEKRARLEQRPLLFYFTDGGMPCKALDAGALSAGEVVDVSRRFFPILLECPDDKAHAELRAKFKVSGFPTLVILEPDGKTHSELTGRSPAELMPELAGAADKFPGREVLWLSSLEPALEKAKEERRPVAIYFHAADEDLADAQDKLIKVIGQARVDKFTWVEMTSTLDDKDPVKTKYDLLSLPAIGFLDPRFSPPKQFGIYDLKAKAKPKDVQERIEKALKKYKDTKVK